MEVYLTKTIRALREAVDKALLPPKAKKGKAAPHTPQEVLACTTQGVFYALYKQAVCEADATAGIFTKIALTCSGFMLYPVAASQHMAHTLSAQNAQILHMCTLCESESAYGQSGC